MKSLTSLACSAFLLLAAPAFAQHDHHAAAPAPAPSAEKADYPSDTCVVSGEKLGEMGDPYDYVYKEAGKPDRLVRLCCEHCVKKFKKDPAKYLKKLDEAAAAKAAGHSESKN